MTTPDIDKIYATKKKNEGRLLAIPGVHAVGLGAKYVGGRRTREPAIMVFVTSKRPVSELARHEIIPAEIDGLRTDVMESGPARPADDNNTYRPMRGGVSIQGGGGLSPGGTLGCLARTNAPNPIIVGLTNQHCVNSPPHAFGTKLNIPHIGKNDAFELAGTNTPGTLVVAWWAKADTGPKNFAFYTTLPGDALGTIATRIAAAMTELVVEGVLAVPSGPRVTVSSTAGDEMFCEASVVGPGEPDEGADLHAAVTGNDILLSGRVAGNYGIFTSWNFRGLPPSGGIYTPVLKGRALARVANDIAAGITARALPGLTATAKDAKVTVDGPQELSCRISSDVRIGQPTNCLCSACCICCANFIGIVKDGRADLDVAMIELAGGLQYLAEIQEIGPITGTHSYTLTDVLKDDAILVSKRGARTGLTHGAITAVDVVGFAALVDDETKESHSFRSYSDVITVNSFDPLNKFSDRGDSGSAVVNEQREVIGIMFGSATETFVTPIAAIETAFDLSVLTATAPGQVSTVPATQAHGFAFSAIEPEPLFVGRLRDMASELTATRAGRELADVGWRHAAEVVRLVNHNRRVGTIWRRSGGPELVQAALVMAQSGEKHVPQEINARPLADSLKRMHDILIRYGSAQLAADLRRYGPRILELAKLDFPELLVALEAPG